MYLLPLIVGPLLFLAVAYFVVPTDWFAERSNVSYLVNIGYGSKLHNADCQVLIYGDSSAMIGADPALIKKQTGLSVCNVAEFAGMTVVNDTMVVDDFLRENKRPRFLIFWYSPENFDPQGQAGGAQQTDFEAITWRMRQPHRLISLFALLRHPEAVFKWAERGNRLLLTRMVSKPFPPEVKLARFANSGQYLYVFPLLTSCSYGSKTVPPSHSWVDHLRSEYGKDGTTVLIDAMPVPMCDPDLAYYKQRLSGVIDNTLGPFPVTDYYSGGRHVNPAGSVLLSNMIADQLNQRLQPSKRPN